MVNSDDKRNKNQTQEPNFEFSAQGKGDEGDENLMSPIIRTILSTSSVELLHSYLSAIKDRFLKHQLIEILTEQFRENEDNYHGDHADFHNLATEGSRQSCYEFSHLVLNRGLRLYPNHPTLLGDKLQALIALGKPEEAIQLAMQFWDSVSLKIFAKDWRVAVFLKKAVEEIDPTFEQRLPSMSHNNRKDFNTSSQDTSGDMLIKILGETLKIAPDSIKIWHELAHIYLQKGEKNKALTTLEEGLEQNPLSQQIRFTLGQWYLETATQSEHLEPTISKAVEHLMATLLVDYQSQYQSDVNTIAVLLRLAQAMEAKALFDKDDDARFKAESLYEQVANRTEEGDSHFVAYAAQRLMHLRTFSQVSTTFEDTTT